MRRTVRFRIVLALTLALASLPSYAQRRRTLAQPRVCAPLPAEPASTPYVLRYDQLGYLPGARVSAVVMSSGSPAPRFTVHEARSRCEVLRGLAGPRVLSTTSRAQTPMTGDMLELSSITRPGDYVVVLEDGSRFGPITIGRSVYDPVIWSAAAFLRTQRCGPTDHETSQHGACHLFASVVDSDPETASGDGVRSDTQAPMNVEGGWHDAGDYLKFATTASFVTTLHLIALRDYGGPPELYAEMKWGLDWLRRMMGGVDPFIQVGGEADHTRWRAPEDDTYDPLAQYEQRPAFRIQDGAGRNVLAKAAAAFAIGAEVFSDPEHATLARTLYEAARRRAQIAYAVPPRFYAERSGDDDLAVAAAALYRLSGESRYRQEAYSVARSLSGETVITWYDMAPLALGETALLFPEGSVERQELTGKLRALIAPIAESLRNPRGPAAAWGYALRKLGNGSLAMNLGAAASCIAADRVSPNPDCIAVAQTQLNWLFGRNPFGVSFMIGLGDKYPQNPHHQVADIEGVTLVGAIVGGPTNRSTSAGSVSRTDEYAKWSTDELLYEDDVDNYVTNEPAIDFLATLPYVVRHLQSR